MHGLGNDFVVIDAINQTVQLNAEQVKQLADRHYGIGFDQLLLVKEAQSAADFRYVIYNADGSEVSQCGNGARCFALFVRQKGLTNKANIRVETGAGDLLLHVNDDQQVSVDMGEPVFAPCGIPLLFEQQKTTYSVNLSGNEINFSALSMGNPHAVIQVADVATADVISLGAQLENHSLFPERANVGFSEIIDPAHIRLRVYERGAGETLACGSGACAAAVAGIQLGLVSSPVNVTLTGGDLNIEWLGEGYSVKMTGPANFVFDGMIEL
ncbi:MAG: diaminopimelate epimerase [Cycloclasticus sp.]|nr:diaminopimelate epimerase [Cycloclasticus sp.]MBQ0790822.1 diaminopimelate epimerase [Cycloclasticus sp.]